MKYLLWTSICLSIPFSLNAGEVYRLSVKINQDKQNTKEETHTWYVEKREFRLKIDGQGRTVDYIFTGRSLLACLKVNDSNSINAVSIHKDLKKALESGLCIVAPINIMTSFFISPYHSISFVKTDESMKSTLKVEKFVSSGFNYAEKVSVPCEGHKRDFEFSFDVEKSDQIQITGKERACYVKANWRDSIWKEISRRLLQQPKAKDLRAKLKSQELQSLGILVNGEIEINQSEGKSKSPTSLKLFISLNKHEKSEIHARYFQKPESYQMVSTFQSAEKVLVNLNADKKEDDGNSVTAKQILRLFMFPVLP